MQRQLSPWGLYTSYTTSSHSLPELVQPQDFAGYIHRNGYVASTGKTMGLEWMWWWFAGGLKGGEQI